MRGLSRRILSLMMAVLLIVGGLLAGISYIWADDTTKIRVLEITDKKNVDGNGNETVPSELGDLGNSYVVTTISMKKFVALREELDGKYDVIYIASGTYSTKGVQGKDHDTKAVMNDITNLKAKEIKEKFIENGQPVVLHEDIFKTNGGKLKDNFYTYKTNPVSNVKIVSSAEEARSYMKTITIDSLYRPHMTVTPPDTATIYKPGDVVSFGFRVPDYGDKLASHNIQVNLYLDTNFDKKYETSEIFATTPLTSRTGELTYKLAPGYSGIRYWKLEVEDKTTHLKAYETGAFRFRDKMVEVKALQVTKDDGKTSSLLTQTNMNQSYLKSTDYNISIDVMSMNDFNASGYKNLNGKYDMLIFGFADVYNGASISDSAAQAVKTFIQTGQGVMFTHDTIFGSSNNWITYFMNDTGQQAPMTDLGNGAPNPSTRTKKVNDGMINQYPFALNDNVAIARTHNQYYTLNLEDPDVVPWYNIISETTDSNKRDQDDSWNHYYTYSKGTVTYSGTGHTNTKFPDEEQKLFVNTIYRAFVGANHAPELTVYTPKTGTKIRTGDKLPIVFKAEDFDLADRNLNVTITANNKVIVNNESVPTGTIVSKTYDDVLPKGTNYKVKIEVKDKKGAIITKEMDVTVDDINSDLRPNRAFDDGQTQKKVATNTGTKIMYTVNPADIPEDKMPLYQGSSATGLRPIALEMEPNSTGDKTYMEGKEYSLVSRYSPSNYGSVSFDKNGKSVYEDLLRNGYGETVAINSKIDTEPGNTEGKTFTILDELITKGNKIITIPLVDSLAVNGRKEVTVKAFGTFELKKKTNDEIVGVFKGYGTLPNTRVMNVTFNEVFPKNLNVNITDPMITVESQGTDGAGNYQVAARLKDIEYTKRGNVYQAVPYTFTISVTPTQNGVYVLSDSSLQYTDLDNKTTTAAFNPLILQAETRVISVELNKKTTTIKKDDSEKLIATIHPDDATNQAVKWTSSNPDIATVDENGVVTGKKYGKTTITVTTVDGEKTDSCVVTVIDVKLDKNEMQLNSSGGTGKLTATVMPADAPNKDVVWTSSDETVAVVDQNGLVQALRPGTAVITVKTVEGGASDSCAVTVKEGIVSVVVNPPTLSLQPSQSAVVTATVTPVTAPQEITWSADKPDVVKIEVDPSDPHKLNVTALQPGTAVVTAATADGSRSATCVITVAYPALEPQFTLKGVSIGDYTFVTIVPVRATIIDSPDNDADKETKWFITNTTDLPPYNNTKQPAYHGWFDSKTFIVDSPGGKIPDKYVWAVQPYNRGAHAEKVIVGGSGADPDPDINQHIKFSFDSQQQTKLMENRAAKIKISYYTQFPKEWTDIGAFLQVDEVQYSIGGAGWINLTVPKEGKVKNGSENEIQTSQLLKTSNGRTETFVVKARLKGTVVVPAPAGAAVSEIKMPVTILNDNIGSFTVRAKETLN